MRHTSRRPPAPSAHSFRVDTARTRTPAHARRTRAHSRIRWARSFSSPRVGLDAPPPHLDRERDCKVRRAGGRAGVWRACWSWHVWVLGQLRSRRAHVLDLVFVPPAPPPFHLCWFMGKDSCQAQPPARRSRAGKSVPAPPSRAGAAGRPYLDPVAPPQEPAPARSVNTGLVKKTTREIGRTGAEESGSGAGGTAADARHVSPTERKASLIGLMSQSRRGAAAARTRPPPPLSAAGAEGSVAAAAVPRAAGKARVPAQGRECEPDCIPGV